MQKYIRNLTRDSREERATSTVVIKAVKKLIEVGKKEKNFLLKNTFMGKKRNINLAELYLLVK